MNQLTVPEQPQHIIQKKNELSPKPLNRDEEDMECESDSFL